MTNLKKQMTDIKALREKITQLTNPELIAQCAREIAELKPNYRPMVFVENKWVGNALVFATREEAEANVKALEWRWMAVKDTRVDETDEPANYSFIDGRLERLETSNG